MIRSYKGVTPQFPETSYIDDSAQLIGDVIIGENSSVWMNAVLRGDVHQIRVRNYSNIHDSSIILNAAVIGSASIIAAGTLIPEKTVVEPNSLWMGSPGKFRRHLDKKDEETILRYVDNYVAYTKSYLLERKGS